jgi:hypothetical protein
MAISKRDPIRISSLAQIPDTVVFHVAGDDGIFRALTITLSSTGMSSEKDGTNVKEGSEKVSGGGAATKEATGSGDSLGGVGDDTGVEGDMNAGRGRPGGKGRSGGR